MNGDKSWVIGSSQAGASVSDGAVRAGELSKVVSNHVDLDLNQVEDLSVVDGDLRADHLGEDDHVSEVCLDGLGLVAVGLCIEW